LIANGQGGDGGLGGGELGGGGAGGDGFAGEVAVVSTARYQIPTQHGTLNAGSITGTAAGVGGLGSTDGSGIVEGGSSFEIDSSTVNIGSLNFNITGDSADPSADPSFIRITNATVDVDSTFAFSTIGDLSFYIDNGSLGSAINRVDSLVLSAGNFVADAELDDPANVGTAFATNLSVTSDGDFIADANLDVVNGIDITVPGSILFDNAVSDSFVDLWAQGGSIDIGNVDAGSSVSLVADSFITGGNIDAGGAIFAQTFGGNIDLGSLTSTFGSIFVDATGDVDLGGDALADGDIEVSATGDIVMLNAMAGESVDLSADGNVTALNLTGGDSVDIDAGGAVEVDNLSAGLVNPSTNEGADYRVSILAGGDISTDNIEAAGNVGLATPGAMTTLDINAGGTFIALGHGDMSFGDATASEVFLADFAMSGPGGITVNCIGTCGTLGADGVVTTPPTGSSYLFVTTEGGEAGAGQLDVGGTNGSLYTTSAFDAAAGDDLSFWFNYVTSDGSSFADYAWAALFTTGLDQVAILFTARTQPEGTIVPGFGLPGVEATLNPSSVPIIGGAPEWSPLGTSSSSCFAAGCGFTGWISSTYEIADAGSYVLRFGVTNYLDTGFQSGMAFSGITVGGSAVGTAPIRTGGSINIGNVNTGKFTAAAGTSLTTGIIDSSGSIALDAGGAITTSDLFAGDFVLANGGSITTQNIEANSVDMTSTGGNITTLDIDAFGAVALDAFGNISTGDITAGSIDLLADGNITTDNLTTQQLVLLSDGITIQELFPGASITLEAGGDIDTGNINSIDGVYANAGGSITTLDIEANAFVQLLAVDDISTGDITAFSQIDLESSNGGITTQDLLSTDGDINLDAFGNISFASADAATEFDFDSGGNVEGGNVVAGNQISGEAGGAVQLGDLTVEGPLLEGEPFSIGIVAADGISVGNVSGAHGVGFGTLGDLSTGNVAAGNLFMALVGGDTTIDGSIATSGEDGGQVYMAHASMCETGGGCDAEGQGDFNPDIVLALEPVPTGGSITINGPVNTGLFRAAAGTTLTTQSVNAEDAIAFAGGLAVINGAWTVGDAKITSNDIDITANGSISANGDISLVSKNTTRTVVGDGLNLAGYNLSSAEFGKLGANDITIIADTAEGAAPTMFIGTLNANAGGFPEGIDYEFLTGNGDTETAFGSIRVAGNAVFTGMTSENHSVNFSTGLFQLVTEIGSISLFSSGSALGGELGISANRVHIASASILNKLASNPTYTNYQQDLNETPDVQRPEGVLRADTISIGSDNLQDVLIQNTGTGFQGGTPAGFLARQLFINGGEGSGSINLVINGQVVSEGGTLTGVEARDALVPEGTDITPFTSNSTINGCPLTGVCIIPPPPAPPAVDVVDNFIDIITGDALGDSDFGNEDDIDDNEEGDQGADNPINPPQPLFDTRPLIPSGDVNDPVSGTGNPALLGSDQQCEEGEQGQCPANPVEGDSQ
ncbi:MAG TPA: NF038132 family protein, partial [Sphingomicrobium sp.]|nr:NF038132 family protein [Sphingomicrobium sp.]